MEPPRENRVFYEEKKGFLYLDDEWGKMYFRVWANSRTSTGFSVAIDPQTVFAYCDEYGLNKVGTLETVKMLQASIKEKK